ncbi:permease-like cell division protein FtsX [Plantactinospora sp. GCM10030261]|uniref:permease-like cell division protein FtsX n=1 Tax=Plantactinospora sp. GCM10030261 TaxID=3273420 RepID=UPI00360FDA21
MRRAAPILAVLLLAILTACTSGPEDEDAGHTMLTVMVGNDATAAQKGVVEQRLRAMPSVEGVSFEDRKQAYENLRKDSPDLVAEVDPEHMPESFRATVTDPSVAEAIDLIMGTVDGVDSVALIAADVDPRPSRIGLIVRLAPTVTDEQRAAVETAVRALPDVESVEFEDRDAAHERLREQCRGKGDLAALLDRQVVRASLRLQLPLTGGSGLDLPELRGLAGVEAVRLVPTAMI